MIEDCHRRFREDRIVDDLIALLEKHVKLPFDTNPILNNEIYPIACIHFVTGKV